MKKNRGVFTTFPRSLIKEMKIRTKELANKNREVGKLRTDTLWGDRYIALNWTVIYSLTDNPLLLSRLDERYSSSPLSREKPLTKMNVAIPVELLEATDSLIPDEPGWYRNRVARLLLFAPISGIPEAFSEGLFCLILSHIHQPIVRPPYPALRIWDSLVIPQSLPLSRQERFIIEKRKEGMVLEAIGKELGLSRQRVHQLERAVIQKVAHYRSRDIMDKSTGEK